MQVKKSVEQSYAKDSVEYSVMKSICRLDEYHDDNDTQTKSNNWDLFREMIKQASPNCKELLSYCEYGGVEFNCTKKFSHILTDDGEWMS